MSLCLQPRRFCIAFIKFKCIESLLEQSDKVEMMVSEWSCKLPATRLSVARFILLETEELGICSATQAKRQCWKRNHLGLERQEEKKTCKTINPLTLPVSSLKASCFKGDSMHQL